MIRPQVPRDVLNIAGAFIGVGLVMILGFLTWALVYVEIPPNNDTALNVLIGILSTNVAMVVGFFFGSSLVAKKQSDAIGDMAKTAQTAGVTLSNNAEVASFKLQPGEQATATATDDGTTISQDP